MNKIYMQIRERERERERERDRGREIEGEKLPPLELACF